MSLYAIKFGKGQWSFIGPGSEKKWFLWKKTVPKESGTNWRKRCWLNSRRADVQFSVLRLHCPKVNSKAKDMVNCQFNLPGLETLGWENHSWKYVSLIGDERIINLQRTNVYVFSDSVSCLGKIHQNLESNKAWGQRIGWITSSQSYRNFDGIDGEPTEFEWNIFPGFDTLQLCDKVKSLLSRLGETPEKFRGRILFMSMFNDISCEKKDNERECLANAKVVSICAKKFGFGHWSFVGPGSEKK